MEIIKQDAPEHIVVQEGSGEEATALGGRGGAGGHLQGIQHLWAPPVYGDLLPIPGVGDLGGERRLDGGGRECFMVKGGVEEDDENTQQVGGVSAGVRIFL